MAVAGCEALVKPSREARISSAEAGEAHFAARIGELRRSVFYTFSSDSALNPGFSVDQGHFAFTPHSTEWSAALAAGISRDGYLLTAGHVARKYNWAVGWMNGRLSMAPARVVEKRDFGVVGAEFAVLRVRAAIDCPLAFSDKGGFNGDIYAMASERGGAYGIDCLAGRALSYSKALGASACFVLLADFPTWHGDSGGPVLSSDGDLVGVDVGWTFAALFSRPAKTVCCPNPALIRSIIDRDRGGIPGRDRARGRLPRPRRAALAKVRPGYSRALSQDGTADAAALAVPEMRAPVRQSEPVARMRKALARVPPRGKAAGDPGAVRGGPRDRAREAGP